jgi:hypothetical protein
MLTYPNKMSYALLQHAVTATKDEEDVRLLLDAGATPDEYLVRWAARNGMPAILSLLLRRAAGHVDTTVAREQAEYYSQFVDCKACEECVQVLDLHAMSGGAAASASSARTETDGDY